MSITYLDDDAKAEEWDHLLLSLWGYDVVDKHPDQPGTYVISDTGRIHIEISIPVSEPQSVFKLRDAHAKVMFFDLAPNMQSG